MQTVSTKLRHSHLKNAKCGLKLHSLHLGAYVTVFNKISSSASIVNEENVLSVCLMALNFLMETHAAATMQGHFNLLMEHKNVQNAYLLHHIISFFTIDTR